MVERKRRGDHLAPGSYLAITHGITAARPEDDPDGAVQSVTNVYRNASAQIHVRPVKDIERFFDGFEIIEPGVVWMANWRPDPGTRPAGRPNSLYGGVGRKPGVLARSCRAENFDGAVAAVHPDPVAAVQAHGGVAASDDGGDAEFAGHDRGVGEWRADVGDDRGGAGEIGVQPMA